MHIGQWKVAVVEKCYRQDSVVLLVHWIVCLVRTKSRRVHGPKAGYQGFGKKMLCISFQGFLNVMEGQMELKGGHLPSPPFTFHSGDAKQFHESVQNILSALLVLITHPAMRGRFYCISLKKYSQYIIIIIIEAWRVMARPGGSSLTWKPACQQTSNWSSWENCVSASVNAAGMTSMCFGGGDGVSVKYTEKDKEN